MVDAVQAYVIHMLRRDLCREPTEREVEVWHVALEVNGAFAAGRLVPDTGEVPEAGRREVDRSDA